MTGVGGMWTTGRTDSVRQVSSPQQNSFSNWIGDCLTKIGS